MGRLKKWLQHPQSLALLVAMLTSLACALAIAATGGRQSSLVPMVFLPVVLAVGACTLEQTVFVGVLASAAYAVAVGFAQHSPTFDQQDVVRIVLLNVTSLTGAMFARRMRLDRDRWRSSAEEKEALLNASQIVASSDKLSSALDSVLLTVKNLVPRVHRAAVFLSDEKGHTMRLAALLGTDPEALRFERFSLRHRRGHWHPDDTQPYYVRDTQLAQDDRMAQLDPAARSVVCVGLRSLTVPIGMLFVSSTEPAGFSQESVRLLQALSDRIAFPLHKIRLQEGLEDLAFTDGMTGLYNYRSFKRHLHDELRRTIRYKRKLALLMLDLDDFKAVNDRYGHPAGNRVLIGVAEIIRQTVRETDLPARYGGEEFAIVCPETDGQEALNVAERIRAAVEASRFEVVPGEMVRITISIGVSSYPLDAVDETSLISAADTALYEAKARGKNRVVATAAAPLRVEAAQG